MNIVQQAEGQLPTFMDDVYRSYLGLKVTIVTSNNHTFSGILRDCNGCILHLEGSRPNPHIYISYDKVTALLGDE